MVSISLSTFDDRMTPIMLDRPTCMIIIALCPTARRRHVCLSVLLLHSAGIIRLGGLASVLIFASLNRFYSLDGDGGISFTKTVIKRGLST